MSVSKPHFLLVDDHALYRMGLTQLLSDRWPQGQVSQAVSWAGAMSHLQASAAQPGTDVVLLDVCLPDADALDHLDALRAVAPEARVVLMSADSRPERVARAREAGMRGWLPKSATGPEILSALESVLAGGLAYAALPYAVLTAPAGRATALQAAESPGGFSARQRDILHMLGRDMPNKAIARQLGVSETEVRVEVSWLTEWLQASSRQEAYAAAVARGVLDA